MTVSLLNAAGDPRTDEILRASVGLLELVFPGRIRACYLSGSYTDATAVPGSDIDALVVFKGELTAPEREQFRQVTHFCSLLSSVLVDFAARGEDELLRQGEVAAKQASRRLIYGEDIREQVPPMPAERYGQLVMHGSFFYLALVRGRPAVLTFPLSYPEPDAEFYGYDHNGLHSVHGWDGSGLKALVGGTSLAATTIVALSTGHCAVRSDESITAYGQLIGDGWADLLEEIYERCKKRWSYRIPEQVDDRKHLSELCRRVLAFENHYLGLCRDWLLKQLKSGNEDIKLSAVQILGQVVFPDGHVTEALKALEDCTDKALSRAVKATLRAYVGHGGHM